MGAGIQTQPPAALLGDAPEPERGVEAMLWRAALSLGVGGMGDGGVDEAAGDRALEAVVRHTARPDGASESRLLRVVLNSVRPGGGAEGSAGDVAWRLVRVGGVPVDVAEHALDMSDGEIALALSRGDAAINPGMAAAWRVRVERADVAAALARVDAMTSGVRRRRAAVNALKYTAFVVVLGFVVYVMLDLREAARQEHEKLTPADIYSLPMPRK